MQGHSWIVIGSSPLARQAYAEARRRWPDSQTITCNRGLSIEPQPDFYFLSDQLACQLWAADGKAAAKRGRTKTVTLRRDPAAMKMRRTDDFDLVLREGYPFEPFQLSGCWCVEFAIRFGAASIVALCGMEGYRPGVGTGPVNYFEGAHRIPESEGLGKDLLNKAVIPLTDKLCAKYPEVKFECLGQPNYEIARPNWHLIPVSP